MMHRLRRVDGNTESEGRLLSSFSFQTSQCREISIQGEAFENRRIIIILTLNHQIHSLLTCAQRGGGGKAKKGSVGGPTAGVCQGSGFEGQEDGGGGFLVRSCCVRCGQSTSPQAVAAGASH